MNIKVEEIPGRHVSSKSNISVLTISGKSRNIKIIAPSPPFYYRHPLPALPPPPHPHFMV